MAMKALQVSAKVVLCTITVAYSLIEQKGTRNIFSIGTKMGKQSSSEAGLEMLRFIRMKNCFSDSCF